MRYRKRPAVIEAIRNEGEWKPIYEWLVSLAGREISVPFGHRPTVTRNTDGSLNIHTLEGRMRAEVGDYLIRGAQGELYPCKPEVFEETYEPAGAAA